MAAPPEDAAALLNVTVTGLQPVTADTVKLATGSQSMVTWCETVLLWPDALVALSVTVYVPHVRKVVLGFCCVEFTPATVPKFHS